jgi:hypothetical protein
VRHLRRGDTDGTPSEGSSHDQQPGFGVQAAVVATVGAALLVAARARRYGAGQDRVARR